MIFSEESKETAEITPRKSISDFNGEPAFERLYNLQFKKPKV